MDQRYGCARVMQLKRNKLRPMVLTLQWPEGRGDPSELSNFETVARKLRYQALGKSCIAENIQTLFLGHHEDDNIETALLRLAQGHGRFGLAGFDSISPIPECQGLWGVSQSGDITSLETMCADRTPRHASKRPELIKNMDTPVLSPRLDIEHFTATGGVYLFRPFRQFPKARLEATCRAAKVPFVIDPTNADGTLTVRNTVRKLLSSGELPRALQSPSILTLIHKNQEAKERLQGLVDDFVKLIHVINFDFQAGTLLVRLPFPDEVQLFEANYNNPDNSYPYINPFVVQLKVVRTLIELVTAEASPQISHKGTVAAAKMFWPESMKDTLSPDTFTLGGVQFQPRKRKRVRGRHGGFPYNFKRRDQTALTASTVAAGQNSINRIVKDAEHNPRDPNVWQLSREPFRRYSPLPVTEFSIRLPDPDSERIGEKGWTEINKSEWTEWKLWDCRYWVRLRAARRIKTFTLKKGATPKAHIYNLGDSIPITMKAMTQEDIAAIRRSELTNPYYRRWYSWKLTDQDLAHEPCPRDQRLDGSRWSKKAFDILLSCFAPGHIRRTIPVLWHAAPQPTTLSEKETAPITPSSPVLADTHSGSEKAPSTEFMPSALNTSSDADTDIDTTAITSFPTEAEPKTSTDESRDDNEKYGNGEYEEAEHYNINSTEALVAAPTFHRRTRQKIWVRMPRKPTKRPSNSTPPPESDDPDSNVDYITPWVIEWGIVYKYVDPVTIRNMNWEAHK
ncbi:adenine nucleotide alpha hydrolase family protein [Emydomyces testavorans]|uniref:tRNA(Ile)-lysidine synthetase n=1 Tax=Emydomyces testavorans TaxID=2070801 RepID=A0AAF0DQ89_9EURO|nr:adenine nucleotide alpha hydrolase family protein [Emydomyces testavorans]